jgi:multidrug efflux pump subunit AcrB
MTSFAFLFGVLPLAVSTGAGATARQIMGTAVMGGTLTASLIAVFLIPVTFYVVMTLSRRSKKDDRRESKENNNA